MLLRPVVAVLLVLAVAGCAGDTGGRTTPPAEFTSIGTLNYSSGPGVSVMYVFDLHTPSDIEVEVRGPGSWNGGEPITRRYTFTTGGRKVTWSNIVLGGDGNLLHPVDGEYSVTAYTPDEVLRASFWLDAASLLPRASGVTIQSSESSVAVGWEAVEGAVSYLVELTSADASLPRGTVYAYTRSPNVLFENLSLMVGEPYYVHITALTADFEDRSQAVLPQAFQTSYTAVAFDAAQ